MRARLIAGLLAAGAVGGAVATTVGSAEAAPQTVTLGSTSGTPSQNICAATFNCTYASFQLNSGVRTPELEVPFDGTVTSFSVNSGSGTGNVELRVLRPAAGGQYTGAGTSPAEPLSLGVHTYAVSLPVRAGDVLGVDNDSSALIFDDSDPSWTTDAYSPAVPDGTTASPNVYLLLPDRLLLSATVQSTGANPTINPPSLTNVSQSHRRWREGTKRARFAAAGKPPLGTTFRFTVSEPAKVRFAFSQVLPGRKVNGKCVAPTTKNGGKPGCTRLILRGVLSHAESAGGHRLIFQGRISRKKLLPLGRYKVTIAATNSAGLRSQAHSLRFAVVAR